jgi:hypothetical protein
VIEVCGVDLGEGIRVTRLGEATRDLECLGELASPAVAGGLRDGAEAQHPIIGEEAPESAASVLWVHGRSGGLLR